MDYTSLIKEIIDRLVEDPESVSVKEFENTEEDVILVQVMVPESEMGIVIGRNGKTISAIRTLVQASVMNKLNKKININVDSY